MKAPTIATKTRPPGGTKATSAVAVDQAEGRTAMPYDSLSVAPFR